MKLKLKGEILRPNNYNIINIKTNEIKIKRINFTR